MPVILYTAAGRWRSVMTPVPHQKGQQWAQEQISCHQSWAAWSAQTSASSSTHSQLWFSLRRSTLTKNRYHSKTKAATLWQINDPVAEVAANEADPLATRLVCVSFIDPLLQWPGWGGGVLHTQEERVNRDELWKKTFDLKDQHLFP